jgi:hypothetical protein
MEKKQNTKTAPFASYYVLQEERYFVILHTFEIGGQFPR